MQPALFSVRSNLAQLPRSISPHLTSSSSSSSIRSLSPSRRSSPHLRSRSASPSPRRFASVLAYHATPPPGGYGNKQRTISADQQLQQQQEVQNENDRGSREHSSTRESREREESPSRIAVRNLEESWKRFELDSGPSSPSSPSLVSSSATFGSPRPSSSPSPLSRPPYRELIECTFFKDSKVVAPAAESESGLAASSAAGEGGGGRGGGRAPAVGNHKSAVLNSESSNSSHDDDHRFNQDHRRTTKAATPSTTTTTVASSSHTPISSTSANNETTATDTPSDSQEYSAIQEQEVQQQVQNAFLASNEARHILDLPSLLGQEPDRISQVLAMPIPLQPKPRSSRPVSLNSNDGDSTPMNEEKEPPGSALISKLNAKADSTAEAMTKRYAAKNLNMTETEAHRMVQLMAAEIVALHEERAVMVKKMEQAKQEMLEAARLLRMKAADSEAPEELQDMSEVGRWRRRSLASGSGTGGGVRLSVHENENEVGGRVEKRQNSKEEEEEEDARQRRMYDRDEWRE
ncbi:MAG: hypothetical protein J3R72DRAFT_438783 [Linnemannia gamsii]|nr:MAG: hypothetical protein J3R72DRAFT_438783 [Linnemannia gamsii]